MPDLPDSEGQTAPIRAVCFLNNHPTRRVTESWGGILTNEEPPEPAVAPATTFYASLASSECSLEVLPRSSLGGPSALVEQTGAVELPMVPVKKGYLLDWSRDRREFLCGAEKVAHHFGTAHDWCSALLSKQTPLDYGRDSLVAAHHSNSR